MSESRHTPPATNYDLAKTLLGNLLFPEKLDEHPWAQSLVAREIRSENDQPQDKTPGYYLTVAAGRIFKSMRPGSPPKLGKRLDTRWGEFGLIAAQYFAPYLFGMPEPVSLRDAWGKIDQSILLFVFEKPRQGLSEAEIARYRLVGNEPDVAANSTLSDWNRNGIKQFVKVFNDREQHLLFLSSKNPGESESQQPRSMSGKRKPAKWLSYSLLLLFVIFTAFISYKAWRAYELVGAIRADYTELKPLVTNNPDITDLAQAGPKINKFHTDIHELQAEVGTPLQVIAWAFPWVPQYGPDLAAAPNIIDLAESLSTTVEMSYQAAGPLMEALSSTSTRLTPASITAEFVKAQPGLLRAKAGLDHSLSIRARIDETKLSPGTQDIIAEIDNVLGLMDDSLSTAIVLPKLLGASSDGPKTYLILLQNEDELRATGGFITSVGSFVISNGDIGGLKFQSSDDFEDWTKPYPSAPWQVQEYMNIPVLLLRDANWSPDYPATASLVEYLYAYNANHSVDGIITIDQQVVVSLLKAIGPVNLKSVGRPISSGNLITYMREAKVPPEESKLKDWDRKAFITDLGSAILDKLLDSKDISWDKVRRAILNDLNKRHILIQMDNSDVADLLARHGWDGAVRPGSGDFLMSTDTNIGYNKTNTLIDETLAYTVDLSDLAAPTGSLVIFHKNRAMTGLPCIQFGSVPAQEKWYPINRCYYDYLRIYLPDGTHLTGATPQTVPAEWLMSQQAVPARIDPLSDEIDGVQGFGTLLVVPGGQSLSTEFNYVLPGKVIYTDPSSGLKTYTLKIQKQPGTPEISVTIRIHLPTSAHVVQLSPDVVFQDNNILIDARLDTDIMISVVFSMP